MLPWEPAPENAAPPAAATPATHVVAGACVGDCHDNRRPRVEARAVALQLRAIAVVERHRLAAHLLALAVVVCGGGALLVVVSVLCVDGGRSRGQEGLGQGPLATQGVCESDTWRPTNQPAAHPMSSVAAARAGSLQTHQPAHPHEPEKSQFLSEAAATSQPASEGGGRRRSGRVTPCRG
jgi:hypothetical protein